MTAPKTRTLPYPPPWQDMATLCEHICVSPGTVETWVAQGILPPARKRGGKLLWRWDEVDEKLRVGRDAVSAETLADQIRESTRAESNRTSSRY